VKINHFISLALFAVLFFTVCAAGTSKYANFKNKSDFSVAKAVVELNP